MRGSKSQHHHGSSFSLLLHRGVGRTHTRAAQTLALVFFVLGLISDTWATGLMFEYVGGLTFDIHGISGLIAIILMLIHAIWAAVVLIKKDEKAIMNLHKFRIAVWLIWLIPYFSPMFFNVAT